MKLNIACAGNVFPAPWLNVDLTDMEEAYFRHIRGLDPDRLDSGWSEEQKNHVRWLNAGTLRFEQRDLRKGFADFADGSVDAIYLGQVVEHLNPLHELPKLLAECYRLLRKGGAVRIVTPDLAYILSEFPKMDKFAADQPAFFKDATPLDQFAYLIFGASGEGCTRENYEGHFHLHYLSGMFKRLGEAGFSEIAGADYFGHTLFHDCIDKGMSHSFAVEAVK